MPQGVSSAVNIVLSVFAMICAGALLYRAGWLDDSGARLISKLVVMLALPFMIVGNLFGLFDRESMLESLPKILLPVASILINMAAGALCGRFAGIPRGRRGVLNCMFCYSNAVFIGVPVTKALFGDEALPYTLMYYIANTALFWTVGIAMLRGDAGVKAEPGDIRGLPKYLAFAVRRAISRRGKGATELDPSLERARNTAGKLKKALPLPLVVFVACMLLILWGARIPEDFFLMSAANYLGGMVTPLSLLFIGTLIMRMIRKGSFRWHRGYEWVLVGRFVLSPLAIWALAAAFGVGGQMRDVFILQAAMPVMTQTSIVAEAMGADSEYAAGATALTTLLSLAMIPIYMAILGGA